MDEKNLKVILNRVKSMPKNYYPEDTSLNLLDLAKDELLSLNITYQSFVYKSKERLKIFDDELFVKDYTKNFYQNNSMFGFSIANNKLMTEKYLKLAQIPTTNSILLKQSQYKEALKYFIENPSKKVIKPLDLSNGRGVYINVDTNNLEFYWNQCVNIQKKHKVKHPKILIQNIIKGFEIRIIVTEGKVISATLRTPPYVIGDGKNNISDLIDHKNKDREKNKFFYKKSIKKNKNVVKYLQEKELTLNSILKSDEICILYPLSNLINGGENIVVTELLHKNILELARKAVVAIPGIHTAGVDIMIEHIDSEKAHVLEVNKAPAFQLNYYPFIGKPQKPLEYIFSSLIIENRVLNDKIKLDNLTQKELDIILERYKFLYEKQICLTETLENLEHR